jgi:toxin ParE1/3/4
VPHRVVWREQADADLDALYDWIAEQADPDVAHRHLLQIVEAVERLTDFPNRGRPRDGIRSGLRSIPFERSVTIFYHVVGDDVQVLRVIHARRDVAAAFDED